MLKSRKWAKIIVCGLMVLFSSTSFAAGTTNVTDGMTFEMTAVAGSNPATDFNVYASYIDCSGACTVKIRFFTAFQNPSLLTIQSNCTIHD